MKLSRQSAGFYGFITIANILVGVMFYVVSIPPPVLAVPPKIIVTRPANAQVASPIVGIPERLVIPDIGIDVSVDTGSFDQASGSWTTSDDRAYYADVSVPVNNTNGKTLIYGHAQRSIFINLPALQKNTQARVYTDRLVFTYRYEGVKEVTPTDTSVFTAEGDPTLVLQTCTGPYDRYRALYSFKFVSVKRI